VDVCLAATGDDTGVLEAILERTPAGLLRRSPVRPANTRRHDRDKAMVAGVVPATMPGSLDGMMAFDCGQWIAAR
jgi:hypothetical protein